VTCAGDEVPAALDAVTVNVDVVVMVVLTVGVEVVGGTPGPVHA
jgi:hypothetical protein